MSIYLDSSLIKPGNFAENILKSISGATLFIIETVKELSNPPDREAPSFTSLLNLFDRELENNFSKKTYRHHFRKIKNSRIRIIP